MYCISSLELATETD